MGYCSTRNEAYQRILSTSKVSEQQKKVLEAISVFGPLDRSEIASVLDMGINVVCGSVS